MASRNELEMLAGKALVEDNFRHQLIKDPAATAKQVGVTLTVEQITQIKHVNPAAFDDLAAQAHKVFNITRTPEWGG